jgi:hypothetical protein
MVQRRPAADGLSAARPGRYDRAAPGRSRRASRGVQREGVRTSLTRPCGAKAPWGGGIFSEPGRPATGRHRTFLLRLNPMRAKG